VVLVAMTMAGIAMMRSVDTATLVAGNLAFQQAATKASDKGIEAAMLVIQSKSTGNTTQIDDATSGYFATLRAADSPSATTSWQSFWASNFAASANSLTVDQFGNTVYFVIHRECANAAPAGSGGQCVASPAVTASTGNAQEAGEVQLTGSSQVYYRITVRVTGPRRTETYVQSHVTL
jgi:type IV pilus assembly protein PilX